MKNVVQENEKAISGAIKIDEKEIQTHLDRLVRQSVEDTLNELSPKLNNFLLKDWCKILRQRKMMRIEGKCREKRRNLHDSPLHAEPHAHECAIRPVCPYNRQSATTRERSSSSAGAEKQQPNCGYSMNLNKRKYQTV